MNYKSILTSVLGIASVTAVLHAQQRPNIVYIMGDDLTYTDIGCYGGVNSITPNIDRLAEEGLRFLNCHQTAPMCSPTRQNLLTGLYPVRNGAYPNHSWVYEGTKSIAHYLMDLGYNVGLQGKRHIGSVESFPFNYFDSRKMDIDTSLFSSFIAESVQSNTPFALFLMSNHPHGNSWSRELGDESLFDADKLVLPPHFIDTPETREIYVKYLAAMNYLDQEVGMVIQTLKKHGVYDDNTLVMFASEQGHSWPFAKWTLYSEGLQSALIARWPGHIKAGTTTNAMVEYVDFTPTMIEAAGGKAVAGLDGVSFFPVLLGAKDTHKEYTYGIMTSRGINQGPDYYGIRSVYDGRYRYILNLTPEVEFNNVLTRGNNIGAVFFNSWRREAKTNEFARERVTKYQWRPAEELYDRQNDQYELINLADDPQYIEIKRHLQTKLAAWMQQQGDVGQLTELRASERQQRN